MADKIEKVLEIEVVNQQATEALKKTSTEVDKLDKSTDKASKSTKNLDDNISNLPDGLKGVVQGFKGAVTGIKSATKASLAFIATPLGAFLAIVSGAFAAVNQALNDNEEGQNKLLRITNQFNGILGILTDTLSDVGLILINIFENPQQALKDFAELLETNITNRFNGLIELIPSLGSAITKLFEGDFKGAAKEAANATGKAFLGVTDIVDKTAAGIDNVNKRLEESVDLADTLTEGQVKRDKLERRLIVRRAELDAQIAEARRKAADEESFSATQRLKEAEEAQRLTQERFNLETQFAELQLQILQQQNTQSKSNKDALKEEAQLEANIINLKKTRADQERTLIRETQRIRREALEEQEELERGVTKSTIDLTIKGEEEKVNKQKETFDELVKKNLETQQKQVEDNQEAVKSKNEANQLLQNTAVDVFNNIGNAVLSGLEQSSAAYKAFAIGIATANLATQLSNIATTNTSPTQPGNLISFGAIGAGATTVQGAAAIANYALNVAQISGAFAGGGEFITNGVTDIRVGDNPGGRERVTVEPLSGKGQTKVFDNKIQMAGGGTVITDGGSGAFNTVSSTRDSANIASSVISAFKNMPAPIVGVEDIARVQARVQVKDRTNRLG